MFLQYYVPRQSHLECKHGIDKNHLASIFSYFGHNCVHRNGVATATSDVLPNNQTFTTSAARGCRGSPSWDPPITSHQGPAASDPRCPRRDGERVHSESVASQGDLPSWARCVEPFLPRARLGDQPGRGFTVHHSDLRPRRRLRRRFRHSSRAIPLLRRCDEAGQA